MLPTKKTKIDKKLYTNNIHHHYKKGKTYGKLKENTR
jgi:hypothetical protein